MLKKLFSPEVHDICPNCGEACAITDILCPKCGKNLDELFEQLSDSGMSSVTIPKWLIFPAEAKRSRVWRVLNSLILIITLGVPWEVVYSDILPSKPFTVSGLVVLFHSVPSIPNDLSYILRLDCLFCVSLGLIAIGHLSLMLYAALNFLHVRLHVESRDHNLRKVLNFCVITSCLVFLRLVTPVMMIAPAWGYWLACLGLLSSLWLETADLIANKPYVQNPSPKAA
jgi:hypothetical protein